MSATGEIGLFKVLSESSSAAGIRRLEIVTGAHALHYVNSWQERLHSMAGKLKTSDKLLEDKLEALIAKNRELEEELKKQSAKHGGEQVNELLTQAENLNGFRFFGGGNTG